MPIEAWFPPLATISALGMIGWLFRNWIITRLKASVSYEFDSKLESLRADLRIKEAEIATLRASAMTALSNRQISIDKRRLEAIEQLWSSIISLTKARGISKMMSCFDYERVAVYAQKNESMRETLSVLGGNFDFTKDLKQDDASLARPFVSPMAWAIYSALVAVIANGVIKWHVAKSGLGAKDFTDRDATNKMMKAALPEYSAYIEKYGPISYHPLIEILELKLLNEFQVMMSGAEADKASIDQAAEILKYATEIQTNKNIDKAKQNVPNEVFVEVAMPTHD